MYTLSPTGWVIVVVLGILVVGGVVYWYIKKREARGGDVIGKVKEAIGDKANDIAEEARKIHEAGEKIRSTVVDAIERGKKSHEEKK